MTTFNKILCPYDFSEYAELALEYSIKLADKTTRITLVNIIHLPAELDLPSFVHINKTIEELTSKTINY